MLTVKIFGKPDCELCKNTIHKFEYFLDHWGVADGVEVEYFDMTSPDGLTEAMMHDASAVPTTVIFDEAGKELARWEGAVPPSSEFKPLVTGGSA